jgi:hypothetical protein
VGPGQANFDPLAFAPVTAIGQRLNLEFVLAGDLAHPIQF